jgi:hypothetical protein
MIELGGVKSRKDVVDSNLHSCLWRMNLKL